MRTLLRWVIQTQKWVQNFIQQSNNLVPTNLRLIETINTESIQITEPKFLPVLISKDPYVQRVAHRRHVHLRVFVHVDVTLKMTKMV